MNWLRCFFILTLLSGLGQSAHAQNYSPSPAQIEQFKRMSPAQREQMAQAAGIDLDSLNMGSGSSAQPQLQERQNRKPLQPQEEPYHSNPPSSLDLDAKAETNQTTKLPLFGHNLFENDVESFQPATNIPVPADYVLGPGDTLVIQLYGKDNSSHSLTINREGQIQFPQIGPISFAGLSFQQAQELIRETVQQQMIGIKASVTMGALRSIRVFVLGEVKRPGSFTVGSLSTMTNALFQSGGISEVGSFRNIQLKRRGQLVTTLDLYDLLLAGDTSNDSRLLPGDVIFVPPVGKTVSVKGAVKRSATYELEGPTTAAELLALAGGLKNTSHLPVSQLIRYDSFGEKDLINLDLSGATGKQFTLRDGDLLVVPEKLDVVSNQVEFKGYIKREGFRPWRLGIRFTDLVPSVLELPLNPEIDIAIIERFNPKTGKTRAIDFSPSAAWAAPGSASDPKLEDYDTVYLFNFENDRTKQLEKLNTKLANQSGFGEISKTVSVSGSVRFPGQYPLTAGMTSSDLIELAGGLSESALDTNGEITRYSINDNRERTVKHISVNFTEAPTRLAEGDTLQVKQIPLWKEKETVTITGEVMFPGTYSIVPGETLSRVLERAGGFTEHAYPIGAVFSREGLRSLEEQRLRELKKQLEGDIAAANANDDSETTKTIDIKEAEVLLKNLESVKPAGRMVIDLPDILQDPDSNDIRLENQDALVIPRYKPSVTVVGEVQYPTSHFFEASLDAKEYIERSGGYKKHADESRTYIVKANGRVIQPGSSAWFKADSELIQAGDTIVIPLETDKVDGLTVWAKVTQIAYQAALGAAAVHGL